MLDGLVPAALTKTMANRYSVSGRRCSTVNCCSAATAGSYVLGVDSSIHSLVTATRLSAAVGEEGIVATKARPILQSDVVVGAAVEAIRAVQMDGVTDVSTVKHSVRSVGDTASTV